MQYMVHNSRMGTVACIESGTRVYVCACMSVRQVVCVGSTCYVCACVCARRTYLVFVCVYYMALIKDSSFTSGNRNVNNTK